ncbi:MAG: hypothetical protein KJ070_27085 [Verrucomicrobia bacterium]|nr:hypothetical protein [Verrucomicrobiota bacterium]
MNDYVSAIEVAGSDLYVGGEFTIAGGKVSAYLAKWSVPLLMFLSNSISVSNGTFQAVLTGPVSNSVVVDGSTTFNDWTPLATNTLPAGGWPLSFPTGNNTQQFYRARFAP